MDQYRNIFLALSSELTGYSSVDLEGTGLVDTYLKLFTHEIGDEVSEILYDIARTALEKKGEARDHAISVDIAACPLLWPPCVALTSLWYLGQWTRMTANWYKYYAGIAPPSGSADPGKTFVPSAQAYTEQLSYRGAGAHPPGAHPTGFGGWGLDPIFGDFTLDNKKS